MNLEPAKSTQLSARMRELAKSGAYNAFNLRKMALALEVVSELHQIGRVSLPRVRTQIERARTEYFIATGRAFTG